MDESSVLDYFRFQFDDITQQPERYWSRNSTLLDRENAGLKVLLKLTNYRSGTSFKGEISVLSLQSFGTPHPPLISLTNVAINARYFTSYSYN